MAQFIPARPLRGTEFPTDLVDLQALATELLAVAAMQPALRTAHTLPHPVDGLRHTVIALIAGSRNPVGCSRERTVPITGRESTATSVEKTDTPAGPTPMRGASPTALSAPRGAVLEPVQRSGTPVTVAAVAVELGTHPNTVRGHLDGLAHLGLVQRARAPAHGRGRPAWQYTAAERVEADQRVRDYAGLATAPAGRLAATAADPPAEELAAGRDWDRILAAGLPAPGPGSEENPRHRVVELLAELGFAPEPTALLPFSEPGACRLYLDTGLTEVSPAELPPAR